MSASTDSGLWPAGCLGSVEMFFHGGMASTVTLNGASQIPIPDHVAYICRDAGGLYRHVGHDKGDGWRTANRIRYFEQIGEALHDSQTEVVTIIAVLALPHSRESIGLTHEDNVVKRHLAAQDIKTLFLHGRSVDRDATVAAFQAGEAPVLRGEAGKPWLKNAYGAV